MTTIPAHKPAELVEINDIPAQTDPLSLAVFGDGGTGKTRLIYTAANTGPLGVVPLNGKCKPTLDKLCREQAPAHQIYFPKEDLIRHSNPMKLAMMDPDCGNRKLVIGITAPGCCAQHYYRWHVNRVKDAIWTMVEHPAIKTIAIDDGTQLYEDMLYAHYGRANRISDKRTAYGPPNTEMIEIINSVKNRKRLIIVHQAKEEYRGETKTGRDTLSGFKGIEFHMSVLAEMDRDPKSGRFQFHVRMCQENASLFADGGKNLLVDDDITFLGLAEKVFGENIDYAEYV